MRNLIQLTVLIGAATMPGWTLSASEGDAKYREHVMEAVGGHMQAMVDILKQEVSHSDHLLLHADAMADLGKIALTLFPQGSEGGDALPAIWEQPKEFQEKLQAFKQKYLKDIRIANTDVVSGTHYKQILEYVDAKGIDLIIMGSGTTVTNMMFGTVAGKVSRLADVPVMLVKIK